MSFKPLFARALAADPDRLHFAAHSHHLWPDASLGGQVECWEDAARLADRKWERVMGEVWTEAQAEVASELGHGDGATIVFSANTHDFLIRLATACPRRGQTLRVLTSDGEFHSARRQFSRWTEEGWLSVDHVPSEPAADFADRFLDAARAGDHDLILVSHVLFGTGRITGRLDELSALAATAGPWVVIDGYHAFMAIDAPCPPAISERAFYLGGGYKYAMAGEGMGFLHCPPGFGPRPPVTGWYAEFDDLSLPPGMVGYAPDAMRFMGATFDPSALYRFLAIRRMLRDNGLTTARISAHVAALQQRFLAGLDRTPLAAAELLNPLDDGPHARFLAFRSAQAGKWCDWLMARNVITDRRGDVLRVGFGLYQDEADVDRVLDMMAKMP